MDGLIEYYIHRPDELESLCLAEFASFYDFFKNKAIKISKDPEDEEAIIPEETTRKLLKLGK